MTRLEILLWTVLVAAMAWPVAARADHYQASPVLQVYGLSMQLSSEAAAMCYDIERLICNDDDRDDVLDELRDLADELDDLNRTLGEAARNPRKWDKLCDRAEDVQEELEELDEEIHEAVDRLNRHSRQANFAAGPRGSYRGYYAASAETWLARRAAPGGALRLTQITGGVTSQGSRYSTPYRGAAEGYTRLRIGVELEDRVHLMLSLGEEIHRLAHR